MHPIAKLTVKARDELTIPTLLTIPRASVTNMKNLSAVMLPHGGPRAYDQIGFDWLAQALPNEGYLVIQPREWHSLTSYPHSHLRGNSDKWGGPLARLLNNWLAF